MPIQHAYLTPEEYDRHRKLYAEFHARPLDPALSPEEQQKRWDDFDSAVVAVATFGRLVMQPVGEGIVVHCLEARAPKLP